jgi:hypothetical protein
MGTPQVGGIAPASLREGGGAVRLQYKARYGQTPQPCEVQLMRVTCPSQLARCGADAGGEGGGESADADADDADAFAACGFWRLGEAAVERAPREEQQESYVLRVRFHQPARAVTPKQALVLYDGDVCLGGGLIRYPARSHFELGLPTPEHLA